MLIIKDFFSSFCQKIYLCNAQKLNCLHLLQRFQIHLAQNFPFLKEKKLLLAISGGVDSMVLFDLFDTLDLNFALAHCNFKLRGASSDKDEEFVQKEAQNRKTLLFCKQFDTSDYAAKKNLSVQMAARELRYDWFSKIISENHFDYLITAHHADDSLETFFINLSRGTGLSGLTGIPEHTSQVIRPLLPFNKKDILDYASEKKLAWREDQSNEETKYLRNKIRKKLVPVLKELTPAFQDSFAVTLQNLQGSAQIIRDKMDEVLQEVIQPSANPHEICFSVKALLKYSNNNAYLYQLFYPYGFRQWDDIRSILLGQTGKQVLSKTHRLMKDRNRLLLSPLLEDTLASVRFEIDENQESVDLGNGTLSLQYQKIDSDFKKNPDPRLAHFDKDLLKFPLIVRKWEKGDYFYPMGMSGKKKLSKFFKDEKFSLLQKENIWLLCSGKDIIWLIGKRMDDRYKISDKTQNVLKVALRA